MFLITWRCWSSLVFGIWPWAVTKELRWTCGLSCVWRTTWDSSTGASSASPTYRMPHVSPSRNCKSFFTESQNSPYGFQETHSVLHYCIPVLCCITFHRVFYMGNSFVYTNSEISQADVYHTIRSYLKAGNIFEQIWDAIEMFLEFFFLFLINFVGSAFHKKNVKRVKI